MDIDPDRKLSKKTRNFLTCKSIIFFSIKNIKAKDKT